MGERQQVHLETAPAWRAWLEEHHADTDGVWLVSWRTPTGRPAVRYEDAVCAALCFGWVDGQKRTLDDERSVLLFTPRRPRSGWARTNKARVERPRAAGLMAPAGERVVAAAVADGSWSLLDEVEALLEPADLRAALDVRPGAWEHWRAFPPSARRALLLWLLDARTPTTRDRRVGDTADAAAAGVRAHPRPPRPPVSSAPD